MVAIGYLDRSGNKYNLQGCIKWSLAYGHLIQKLLLNVHYIIS